MNQQSSALKWLLSDDNPSAKYFTLVDILDEPVDSSKARKARAAIMKSPLFCGLFKGQNADGGFGVHPYQKWTGAHWRLASLVELGIPEGEKRAVAAVKDVLQWLTGESHKRNIRLINGRIRRCASQEGNALFVCCRLGLTDDPRVRYLAESLVEWQWPDGGWNCDKNPQACHSSFYESITPLRGLIEYHRLTGDKDVLGGIEKATELFLRHHLFKCQRTGDLIDPEWLKLHYPTYWHYDILFGLRVFSLLGPFRDHRLKEALDFVESKRLPDGRWKSDGRYYWARPGTKPSNVEVVNWERGGPNKMITLHALRVLKAAGRLTYP